MPLGFHSFGEAAQETLDDGFFFDTDHGIVWSGHSGVRLIGQTSGEDARIGGWDMSMGADHSGGAGLTYPTIWAFFARQLGMKIHEANACCGIERVEELIGLSKWTIYAAHVRAALQVQHR